MHWVWRVLWVYSFMLKRQKKQTITKFTDRPYYIPEVFYSIYPDFTIMSIARFGFAQVETDIGTIYPQYCFDLPNYGVTK